MTRQCLVAVQGPIQFVYGFNAMEWYGRVTHGSADAEAVLLVYDLLVSAQQEKPILDSIMQLAPIKDWKRIVFIGGHEMSWIMRRPYAASIRELRAKIGDEEFDEVYLARNYGGYGSGLILRAYSEATRVIYGDGFGFVCSHEVWSAYFLEDHLTATTLVRKAKALARDVLFGKPPAPIEFDVAVLSIPVDFSGSYLDRMPLFVPSREQNISVFERCNRLLPDLNAYCEQLLEGTANNCYLYLLRIFAEAGDTSADQEVALYEEVIRQNSPVGSTILLKLHPRAFSPVIAMLRPLLDGDYQVRIISQGQYASIPIEFWNPLIRRCPVISFSAGSTVTLKYLYDRDVISGLNEERIEKYIFRDRQKYIKDDHFFWHDVIAALDTWDGQGPLWKRRLVEE